MSTVQTNRIQHSTGTGNNIILNAEGDTQVNSLNGGALSGLRNQLINGDFRVAQRGDDFFSSAPAPTDDPYTLDRWCVSSIIAAQPTRLARQNNDSPPGFAWSVALYANGSPAGASRQSLIQAIELQRPGNNNQFAVGSTWTLSFWIKSGANSTVGVSTGFRPSAQTAGPTPEEFSDTVNTTTSWVKLSHTFTIANTADASDQCFAVIFYNAVAANTAILLSGVQLEPGPVATPFEYRPMGLELALCQRYYVKDETVYVLSIPSSTTNARYTTLVFPQTMRSSPEVSFTLDGGVDSGAVATVNGYRVGTVVGNTTTQVSLSGYTANAEL